VQRQRLTPWPLSSSNKRTTSFSYGEPGGGMVGARAYGPSAAYTESTLMDGLQFTCKPSQVRILSSEPNLCGLGPVAV
jgi:hypothetical protein